MRSTRPDAQNSSACRAAVSWLTMRPQPLFAGPPHTASLPSSYLPLPPLSSVEVPEARPFLRKAVPLTAPPASSRRRDRTGGWS